MNDGGRAPGWRLGLRRAGLLAGGLLVIAALFAIWRQEEVIADALAAVRRPSPVHLSMLIAAMLGNLVLAGTTFSLLMSPRNLKGGGRVGVLEMQALMAATSLANFLPLRPGMVGRIAYHKAVNQINATDSIRAVITAAALSAGAAVYLALAVALSIRLELSIWPAAWLPLVALPLTSAFGPARSVALAGLCRYAEVLLWAVRYHTAFALIGSPISLEAAIGFACIGTVATMVPFFSNGLGLREWAVGLVAPLLAGLPPESGLALGLTAELVNRAVEMAFIAIVGSVAIAWLSRRRRDSGRIEPASERER